MIRKLDLSVALGATALVAIVAACGERAGARTPESVPDAATIARTARGWPTIGGDPGSSHYSGLSQITRDNVQQLTVAWTMRTGEASHDSGMKAPAGESCSHCHTGNAKFEATPILANDKLYLSTPLNRVIALDPGTGKELWRHDPKLDMKIERSEGFVSRGVAYWEKAGSSPVAPGVARGAGALSCERRIFFGTVDARLLA
ncbi:MAG TPA: hypothetical protein VG817_06950, partial [Gemmatimonadales bacterium]|nr:hypothetical protein [Gemmatimonadales bacterium]